MKYTRTLSLRHSKNIFCLMFEKNKIQNASSLTESKLYIEQKFIAFKTNIDQPLHGLRKLGLWLYDSWIYNYLCNQCLSPLKL